MLLGGCGRVAGVRRDLLVLDLVENEYSTVASMALGGDGVAVPNCIIGPAECHVYSWT